MLKTLFLAPGRLLSKLFSREKKKTYRSIRHRPTYGPGLFILSAIGWLVLAAAVLFAVDKAGLLNKALDVGAEVANNVEAERRGETQPATVEPEEIEPPAGSASGTLSGRDEVGGPPAQMPGPSSENVSSPQAQVDETELWLVILHSIPKGKNARDEAERRRNQYRSRGLNVDIMDTDAFPKLDPGYWIVALGPFDEKIAAVEASNRAKTFNSGLMLRRGF